MKLYQKLSRFNREPLIEKFETISNWYWLLKTQFYYRRFFRHIGARSKIIRPLRVKNVEYISIGDSVMIHKHCWLQTQRISDQAPELAIGNGCVIGNFNHITCVRSVHLEDKVLTADGVFITDHGHQYNDPHVPIVDQGIVAHGPVRIGTGSWLGESVAVMSCRIGRNCVIGANSVVLSDIPDYSVAVGAPARVVRRFNPETKAWERRFVAESYHQGGVGASIETHAR